MSNLYREPSIDASYQVSAHLAKGFQRRRLKCEKLRDDRQRTTDDGRKFNIISFKQILLPNNDKRIRHKFFSKWWQKLTLPLARWAKKKGQRQIIIQFTWSGISYLLTTYNSVCGCCWNVAAIYYWKVEAIYFFPLQFWSKYVISVNFKVKVKL